MGGCCAQTTNNKKGKKSKNTSDQGSKDESMQKANLTLRKKVMKREPPKIDDILYLKPQEIIRWVNSASQK